MLHEVTTKWTWFQLHPHLSSWNVPTFLERFLMHTAGACFSVSEDKLSWNLVQTITVRRRPLTISWIFLQSHQEVKFCGFMWRFVLVFMFSSWWIVITLWSFDLFSTAPSCDQILCLILQNSIHKFIFNLCTGIIWTSSGASRKSKGKICNLMFWWWWWWRCCCASAVEYFVH